MDAERKFYGALTRRRYVNIYAVRRQARRKKRGKHGQARFGNAAGDNGHWGHAPKIGLRLTEENLIFSNGDSPSSTEQL
jgi:hypothetical protein